MSFVMLTSLLVLLLSISSFSARTIEAKPLNQNQVKFRRLPPKEFSVAIGSSITIECEAGGSPPPTIHWLKDGRRIAQNEFDDNQLEEATQAQVDDINRIGLSSTRSRLFIDCADVQDEAVYTCVAENAYSRIASHTKLNLIKPAAATISENELLSTAEELVALQTSEANNNNSNNKQQQQQPLSAVSQCLNQRQSRQNPDPVRIHMWTHNVIEIMRNDIVLFCRYNAKRVTSSTNNQQLQQSQQDLNNNNNNNNKQTTTTALIADLDGGASKSSRRQQKVTWTLPDEKQVTLDQLDKYEILDSGDLLIKDLSWSDMGSYVCTVSDEQSSDSISSFVYPASSKKQSSTSKRGISSPKQALMFRR